MREKKSIRARAPKASSSTVHYVMQRIKSRDTGPEKLLRSSLHKKGLRFRVNTYPEPNLKIKADIIFPKQKICIFVDGCFWHGCPSHFKVPKTNSDWWLEKIEDNKMRDLRQSCELQKCGWTVIRYWEHEITLDNLHRVCSEIEQLVKRKKNEDTE